MTNRFFEYENTLGAWNHWTTAITPDDVGKLAKLPGFDLGPVVETGRARAADFTREAMQQVWAAFPQQARDLAIEGINTVLSTVGSAASVTLEALQNAISGIAMGIGVIGPIIEGAFELADMWVGAIQAIRTTNDGRRRGSRMNYLELIEKIGPRVWAGGSWIAYTYERDLGLGRETFPLAWPPDYEDPGPLRLPDEADTDYSGDCSRGSSDFSGGLDSSCRGFTMIFPLFFPVWNERCFGTNKSKKGMERTFDGGAAVWVKMIAMQGALLGNPVTNLQCNGEMVANRVKRFKASFWVRYFTPASGVKGGSATGLRMYAGTADEAKQAESMGGPVWQIGAFDDNFPAALKKGFFLTPGGLIGTYNNDGTGSVDHPDLAKFGVWRWPAITTYSSFGGNFISCRDYNTIISSAGQFFALRTATLRRRVLSETIVDEFPLMLERIAAENPLGGEHGLISYYPIPERKVRRAIRAIADGAPTERTLIKGSEAVPPPPNVPPGPGGWVGVPLPTPDPPMPPDPPVPPEPPTTPQRGWTAGQKVVAGSVATGAVVGLGTLAYRRWGRGVDLGALRRR